MTQDNMMPYDQPEEQQDYYPKVVALLDHYEDGWNFLINAHKANNFDYPLTPKPEHENNPYIPQSWLELTDAVVQIIAKDKYELDVYDNIIEIIRPDQMLDAYTTNGLPGAYRHWSFGKRRMIEEKKFDESKHLAYEIVINSNPCIAYCMDGNSPLLQALVIAHASYGHNSVFKNHYLFKDSTSADTILAENKRIAEYIFECEQKYGYEEVSELLDCCHAMKFIDSSDSVARKNKSQKQIKEQAKQKLINQFVSEPHRSVFNLNADNDQQKNKPKDRVYKHAGEDNILEFMADHAPHLPEWKRNIMRMVSGVSQYFKPQMETKILNEGMATFTHDKIMTTMRDIGLIDWGMYMEYKQINEGVLYQPPAVRQQRAPDGSIQEVLVGAEMNPYTLGLKILEEIERICKSPTEEDKKWFPHFAGEKDWLSVVKKAVFSSTDETFIEQYLSPQAMRDLKMFMLEGLEENNYYEITSVHADDGFRKIREQLAKDQRLYEKLPQIHLHDYQEETDRCLVLRHTQVNNQILDYQDTSLVLEMMHHQWGHPVVIETVDQDGTLVDYTASIPDYDHEEYKPEPAGLMNQSL